MADKGRYLAIDGLRGVAALSVTFYHLVGNLKNELSTWLPEIFLTLFSYGFLGVPIFFVLSGFVISLSLGDSKITPRYVGNFALRRAIRLDFPYWVSILLALCLMYLQKELMGRDVSYPDAANVFFHLLYLQDLLGYPQVISEVYWTLCIEVQLYLFFILGLGFCQRVGNVFPVSLHFLHLVLLFSVGFVSLLVDYGFWNVGINGTFVGFWHYFLLGVLVNLVLRRKPYATLLFFAWIIVEILFLASAPIKPFALAGVATALFILILIKRQALGTVFSGTILQFLGKISYSLYLLHADIGWKAISVGKMIIPFPNSPLYGLLLLLFGLFASIISAYMLHVYVERPAMKFASSLKLKKGVPIVKREEGFTT